MKPEFWSGTGIVTAIVMMGGLGAAQLAWAVTKCVPTVPTSGQILIAGGSTGVHFDPTAAAEIFDPSTQTFLSACNMKATRDEAKALVVPASANAKVANQILILGGEKRAGNLVHLRTTDSYNPVTGKFKAGPAMKKQVEDGTVVQLMDGRFLVTVGETSRGASDLASNQAMIFDPSSGKFTLLSKTLMTKRVNAAAALISGCGCADDGKVLIAGGNDEVGNFLDTAELFDPSTNSFTATANMNVRRLGPTATTLGDGTVLVAGGFDELGDTTTTAEVFDPKSDTFTLTSALFGATGSDMEEGRAFHTATLLNDGTVLLAGGEQDIHFAGDHSIADAEVYDPTTGDFTSTANVMSSARTNQTATLVKGTSLDGKVLMVGGEALSSGSDHATDSADLYDPKSMTFTPTTGNLLTARTGHVAAQVP